MFGRKRHSEIIDRLYKIEQQQRNHYHTITSELACLEREIQDLTIYIHQQAIEEAFDTIEDIKLKCDFISDVFEKATFETEQSEH